MDKKKTSFSKLVQIIIQSGVPAIFWGDAGIGKTAQTEECIQALGLPYEIVLGSTRESTDFNGLPLRTPDGMKFEPPAWAIRMAKEGKGVVVFDDITQTPPGTSPAIMRVVNESWVGDLKLPDSVSFICIANPVNEKNGGYELIAPLANRMCHLDVEFDLDEWCSYINRKVARKSGNEASSEISVVRLPEGWEDYIEEMEMLVASFLKVMPNLAHNMPKDSVEAGRAWPSIRTWSKAARLMAACKSIGESMSSLELIFIQGCVGVAAATQFNNWRQTLSLPDPELLLKDPSKFVFPEEEDKQYAVLNSIVFTAIKGLDKMEKKQRDARWTAAWQLLGLACKKAPDLTLEPATTLAGVRKNN